MCKFMGSRDLFRQRKPVAQLPSPSFSVAHVVWAVLLTHHLSSDWPCAHSGQEGREPRLCTPPKGPTLPSRAPRR